MNVKAEYEMVVVGGGIAGLCIAELFSRSGWKVALLEKNTGICMEASGAHHGWFHFGSLYSIFPNNQFMRTLVGGIDDLIDYYSGFPGMNIRVSEDGRLALPQVDGAWIRVDPIQYIVAARNDKDFNLHVYDGLANYLRKIFFTLTWDLAIKQFISRHQRFHKFDWRTGPAAEHIPKAGWMDYSREVIFKPEGMDCELDPDTHFRVSGFDRPMTPQNIIGDLLKSFIGSGGTFMPSCEYTGYRRQSGVNIVCTRDRELTTKHLVLASGKGLKDHLAGKANVNVVASPLLVAYPAVSNMDLVRLTPFVSKTVNHIKHYANGEAYSVIGGGYFAPPDDESAIARAKEELVAAAEKVFPALAQAEFKEVYVSYKTEMSGELGERNYQYLMRKLDENVFAVVPGKFSLGFSLAVNLYKKLVGKPPAGLVKVDQDIDVSKFFYGMRHQSMVKAFIAKRDSGFSPASSSSTFGPN
ncbi:MAG: FAD-binding oxidoreductase [Sulfuricella sp.]|nr:FAD-binding oxidoreductase [Sulfuricella sp.]